MEWWNNLTKSKHAYTTPGATTDGSSTSNTRLERLRKRKGDGGLAWASCDSEKLREAVSRVVSTGGLVSFSKTTDGGVAVLYIKDGDEELKEYPKTGEEADGYLADVIEMYSD